MVLFGLVYFASCGRLRFDVSSRTMGAERGPSFIDGAGRFLSPRGGSRAWARGVAWYFPIHGAFAVRACDTILAEVLKHQI